MTMPAKSESDIDDDACHGSCERCGCNLYEGDGDYYCDQCEWWIEQGAE